MGPIVENSAPETPLLFQTPPEGVTEEEVSKPIACLLGGGKAPRLSEVHCDRDSVCED